MCVDKTGKAIKLYEIIRNKYPDIKMSLGEYCDFRDYIITVEPGDNTMASDGRPLFLWLDYFDPDDLSKTTFLYGHKEQEDYDMDIHPEFAEILENYDKKYLWVAEFADDLTIREDD